MYMTHSSGHIFLLGHVLCAFLASQLTTMGLDQCTSTMELDYNLWKMAQDLQDTSLKAKLSVNGLIMIEAKYHYNCLFSL